MTAPRSVNFTATFPQKSGAVNFHGEEGTRITLDISEQDKPQALQLPAFFLGRILDVTITIKE